MLHLHESRLQPIYGAWQDAATGTAAGHLRFPMLLEIKYSGKYIAAGEVHLLSTHCSLLLYRSLFLLSLVILCPTYEKMLYLQD